MTKRIVERLKNVDGLSDILPLSNPWYSHLRIVFSQTAENYGFTQIETPVIEQAWLYDSTFGTRENAPLIFVDEGNDLDRSLALRPDGTPGILRSHIQHNLNNDGIASRYYYIEQMFRNEKPGKHSLKQFYQFGLESIDEDDATEDTIVLLAAYQYLSKLGIANDQFNLSINSVGCHLCQPKYLKILNKYLADKAKGKLCNQCQNDCTTDPLRIFNCPQRSCSEVLKSAPIPLDSLCDKCKNHFTQILEYLEETGIRFNIQTNLVRNLSYYHRTVFEFSTQFPSGENYAIIGGGRYNRLANRLVGKEIPAVGLAVGVERLIQLMKSLRIRMKNPQKPIVFMIQLGSAARKKTFRIMQQVTAAGLATSSALSKSSLKTQLRYAAKVDARLAIIIGQREILDGTIILKDMISGGQETIDDNQYLSVIMERISG